MIVKRWVLLIIFIVLLAGCVGPVADSPEPVTLKINWKHGTQFLGFYVAQARGFYADEGLAVTIVPLLDNEMTQDVPLQVAAGDFDFGIGSRILVAAQSEGVPVTAFASIVQLNPVTLFARASSGIQSPADLAGRSIINKSEAWQGLLAELLAAENLTLADVETVPGRFDMTPFYAGEVEVWMGFLNEEVVLARQQGLELVTLPLYEYGILTTVDSLFASQQLISDNPDLAARFLRASLQGWEWALEHPTEAVDIMIEHYPELAPDREFYLASFDAYIPLVRPPGKDLGDIDCQRWLDDMLLAELPTTEGLCTIHILELAWAGE